MAVNTLAAQGRVLDWVLGGQVFGVRGGWGVPPERITSVPCTGVGVCVGWGGLRGVGSASRVCCCCVVAVAVAVVGPLCWCTWPGGQLGFPQGSTARACRSQGDLAPGVLETPGARGSFKGRAVGVAGYT